MHTDVLKRQPAHAPCEVRWASQVWAEPVRKGQRAASKKIAANHRRRCLFIHEQAHVVRRQPDQRYTTREDQSHS